MEPTFWLIILLSGVPALFVLNDKYGWVDNDSMATCSGRRRMMVFMICANKL